MPDQYGNPTAGEKFLEGALLGAAFFAKLRNATNDATLKKEQERQKAAESEARVGLTNAQTAGLEATTAEQKAATQRQAQLDVPMPEQYQPEIPGTGQPAVVAQGPNLPFGEQAGIEVKPAVPPKRANLTIRQGKELAGIELKGAQADLAGVRSDYYAGHNAPIGPNSLGLDPNTPRWLATKLSQAQTAQDKAAVWAEVARFQAQSGRMSAEASQSQAQTAAGNLQERQAGGDRQALQAQLSSTTSTLDAMARLMAQARAAGDKQLMTFAQGEYQRLTTEKEGLKAQLGQRRVRPASGGGGQGGGGTQQPQGGPSQATIQRWKDSTPQGRQELVRRWGLNQHGIAQLNAAAGIQ